MANEEDVTEEDLLQEKMEDTRTAITEKLELLEQKVVDSAAKAVTDSVGVVLDTTSAVKETVATVKETVAHTMDSVKEMAQSGMDTLREGLNLRLQTERHPWLVLGGSAAVGFCLERWLFARKGAPRKTALPPPSAGQPAKPQAAQRDGGYRGKREGPSFLGRWLGGLTEKFAPELDQFKKLALGVVVSLVRDVVANAAPDPWRPKVSDTFNQLAQRLNVEITEPGTVGMQPASQPAAESSAPELIRTTTTPWSEQNLGRRFDRH